MEMKSEEEAPAGDLLSDYEKSFDPGKYELSYEDDKPAAKKSISKNNNKKNSVKKIVSGFRIQTIISGELSECQKRRLELQRLFPDIKTYIINEFPFYKLRIGDFSSRKEADAFNKLLSEKDIKTGQIVPDKIILE
jgi:hypothetical protein